MKEFDSPHNNPQRMAKFVAGAPTPKSRRLVLLVMVLSCAGLIACGRPATEEECREILHRTAELEMQGRLGNKELIKQEIQAIEESMREQMMKKCVGKRITDGAMECVRSAKSAKELTEDCFR